MENAGIKLGPWVVHLSVQICAEGFALQCFSLIGVCNVVRHLCGVKETL